MAKHNKQRLVKEIITDIKKTIDELRMANLIRDEQGVSEKTVGKDIVELTFDGKNCENNIVYDEHLSHKEIIGKLLEHRQYTVLLYDKSIIQAEYIVRNDELLKERLLFIKRHNKVWSREEINSAEAEEIDWFGEEEGIPIFLRIDYDPDQHIECEHAACHFTLSNSKTCRIPVKGPVSFSEFLSFLLLHFYTEEMELSSWGFDRSVITEREKEMVHINWGG